jgi:hypothetical protein
MSNSDDEDILEEMQSILERNFAKAKVIVLNYRAARGPLGKAAKEIELTYKKYGAKGEKLNDATVTRKVKQEIEALPGLIKNFGSATDLVKSVKKAKTNNTPPKLPAKLTVNGKAVYNGSRNTVGFYRGIKEEVIKANKKAWKSKDITCEGTRCKHSHLAENEVTIDHKKSWSEYQDRAPIFFFCYEGWHFTGQFHDAVADAYNDLANLQVMCQGCNSNKSGKKNNDLNKPQPAHPCPNDGGDACKYPKAT